MKKLPFVLLGLFLTLTCVLADNKAYARLDLNPNGEIECIETATDKSCVNSQTITIDIKMYEKLLEEHETLRQDIETYKALEAFWATEVLSATPQPKPYPTN